MLRSSAHIILIMGTLLLTAVGCTKDPIRGSDGSTFAFPEHFPAPHYNNSNNSYTDARFELGKMLFYDPILSADSTISCASCHFQEDAFSDRGRKLSIGIEGRIGTRNSPALFNLAWNTSFMWDGGNNHIEVMPLAPIENEVEMNDNIPNIITKLNTNAIYRQKFKEAYDVDPITDQKFLYALAQFMASMVSSESKYDEVIKGKSQFTVSEQAGYEIFKSSCATCHTEPLMTNYAFMNNGLDTLFSDEGRMRITLQPEDNGKFKVPPLRNLSYSAPYMHDGRFATLEEVVGHYSDELHTNSPGLDPLLQNKLELNPQEKADLLQFLKTLDDVEFTTEPNFSNPFD